MHLLNKIGAVLIGIFLVLIPLVVVVGVVVDSFSTTQYLQP